MAGQPDDENDENKVDDTTKDKQTANKNHKGPKINKVPQSSFLFKFAEDIGQVVKLQTIRKSNISKLSNQIKAALTVIEDDVYQGNEPEGSSVTTASGEIADLKTKLRDSMSTLMKWFIPS